MLTRFTLTLCLLLAFSSLATSADWPQWRGVKRDGMSADTGLLKEWPAEGPKVAWSVDNIGEGYASIAVAGGRVEFPLEPFLFLDRRLGEAGERQIGDGGDEERRGRQDVLGQTSKRRVVAPRERRALPAADVALPRAGYRPLQQS